MCEAGASEEVGGIWQKGGSWVMLVLQSSDPGLSAVDSSSLIWSCSAVLLNRSLNPIRGRWRETELRVSRGRESLSLAGPQGDCVPSQAGDKLQLWTADLAMGLPISFSFSPVTSPCFFSQLPTHSFHLRPLHLCTATVRCEGAGRPVTQLACQRATQSIWPALHAK